MAHDGTDLRPIALAVGEFGIEPTSISLLAAAENISFRVVGDLGQVLVARLHRPGLRTLEELQSEVVWLEELTRAGFPVPGPIRTRSGRAHVRVATEEGPTWMGLTTWVAGTPLIDRLDEAEVHLRSLGALTADLHRHASTWRPPAGFRRPTLDAEGLAGVRPVWGRFWEHPLLTRNEASILAAARRAIFDALTEMRHTGLDLIHADLHVANVLVGDRVALVDFDDCGFGYRAFDLATALHPFRSSDRIDGLRAALLAGYRNSAPAADAVDETTVELLGLVRLLGTLGREDLLTMSSRADVRHHIEGCVARAGRYLAGL